MFSILLVAAETGQLWEQGGIADQPEWFIELLTWFLPRHDTMKFIAKADMILGGSKSKSAKKSMPGPGRKKGG